MYHTGEDHSEFEQSEGYVCVPIRCVDLWKMHLLWQVSAMKWKSNFFQHVLLRVFHQTEFKMCKKGEFQTWYDSQTVGRIALFINMSAEEFNMRQDQYSRTRMSNVFPQQRIYNIICWSVISSVSSIVLFKTTLSMTCSHWRSVR